MWTSLWMIHTILHDLQVDRWSRSKFSHYFIIIRSTKWLRQLVFSMIEKFILQYMTIVFKYSFLLFLCVRTQTIRNFLDWPLETHSRPSKWMIHMIHHDLHQSFSMKNLTEFETFGHSSNCCKPNFLIISWRNALDPWVKCTRINMTSHWCSSTHGAHDKWCWSSIRLVYDVLFEG